MSLFSEFICALSHQELHQLKQLPLRGKQAAIFECILNNPKNEQAIESIVTLHEMSTSHLHATLSMLLQRSYDFFIPERGFDLLLFLQIHGLEAHFKREFQVQEKLLRETATSEQLNVFYVRTLHLLIGVTSSRFDTKFFNALLLMCLKTSSFSASEAKITRLTCEVLRDTLKIAVNPSRDHPQKYRSGLLKRLKEVEHLLADNKFSFSHYHLEYAYSIYYAIILPSATDFCEHLDRLTLALRVLPGYLQKDEEPKLELRKASLAFSQSDFSKAYQLYSTIYLKEGVEFFRMYAFHLDRFTRTALAKKDLATAESLLDYGFESFINNPDSPLGTSEALYRVVIALFKSNHIKAREELARGYKLNTGSNYILSMDIHLRFLEILTELFDSGSIPYVETLIQRSIKHFHRRGMTLKQGGTILNFYALKDIIVGKTNSDLVRESITIGLREYPASAVLLQVLLQRYTSKK